MDIVTEKVCPNCGNKINDGDCFCIQCGYKVEKKEKKEDVSLKPICRSHSKKPIISFKNIIEDDTVENFDNFANGLPDWSLEPPFIVSKRRR